MKIFIDIETTGFSRENDRIIEVAASVEEDGNIIDTYHTLINPGKSITSQITSLTGITNKDVQDKPKTEEALQGLADFFNEYSNVQIVAGHNIKRFDVPFIETQMRLNGINFSFSNYGLIDTLDLAKTQHKLGKLPNYNYFTDKGNASFKLQNLINYYQLYEVQTHRADDDVRHNITIFYKLTEEVEQNEDYGF